MPALPTELRNQLSKAIQDARRTGEPGARKALEALAVHHHEPYGTMSPDERRLRSRLRAHGRQLGDRRDPGQGTQEIGRLAHEVAYEHWHRMLFARFLAENHLLIEPDHGVPLSMGECQELARERGEDPWSMAGRFAERMLPRIFRSDDPVLQVTLPPETRQALEGLLASLPREVFTSDDALGWTYQFWQVERKREVNDSGDKIGADELPAVTQLFTEHYMVCFLFHNTVGAWRAGKVLAERPELAAGAESEADLRDAVRLAAQAGYDFDYLRFVRSDDGEGPWRPAAGTFEGWPRRAADLRVLDPCCGSGHFLVEGLELLVRLRMEEEGLALEDALRAVLADNLFGLELDPRCTQIAAFNLALAAWRMAGRPLDLPPLNVACSGLSVGADRDEWARLAPADHNLQLAMRWLHDEFQQAPLLGSLLDPARGMASRLIDWPKLRPLLDQALAREEVASDAQATEIGVAAQGIVRAAELMTSRYALVITNVPYLGRRDQAKELKEFVDKNHPEARENLATVFLSRILDWLGTAGVAALVAPENWLFLGRYQQFRQRVLVERTWRMAVRLGAGAFDTIGGHVVKATLNIVGADESGPGQTLGMLDASNAEASREKGVVLGLGKIGVVAQRRQIDNPDCRIVFENSAHGPLLSIIASAHQGTVTGDVKRFVCKFWEVADVRYPWARLQGSTTLTGPYRGRENVVNSSDEDGGFASFPGAGVKGLALYERHGLSVTQMNGLHITLFRGGLFDINASVVVPLRQDDLSAIWCYFSSPQYRSDLRKLDTKVNVTTATLVKVPFDHPHWQQVAVERYPHGLPEPQSNDPTQWLFHGHPAGMVAAGPAGISPFGIADPVGADRHPSLLCRTPNPGAVLQVAVARLVGYRWPAELDSSMVLDPACRAWVERCRDLHPFADEDGIVCLAAVRGEAAAADRIRRLLASAFGSAWSATTERALLAAAVPGKAPASLEEWLRDRFFEHHCDLFQHRPFVWHLWDGCKDGFHALVNYHHLAGPNGQGRRTLEALTWSYLGDWIERQKSDQREGREGAEALLAAAQDLQAQLERILEGEPPCDLFARWKPLHQQPLGWDPDLDYGVRVNLRPFMSAELRQGGRKGAGLLRSRPKVDWGKDRGHELLSLRPRQEFPWFWSFPKDATLVQRTDFPGGAEFDGVRWNDLHYTNAARRAARERLAGRDRP